LPLVIQQPANACFCDQGIQQDSDKFFLGQYSKQIRSCNSCNVCVVVQSVFLYWVTSNVFSLGQSVLFKVPSVRKALKLPDLAHMRATATGLPIVDAGKPVVTSAQPPKQKKAKQ